MDVEQDKAVTMCLVFILVFSLYMLVHYSYLYLSAHKAYKNEGDAYKRSELKKMMEKAFNTIRDNANQIAHPYFYNQPIDYIINTIPSFINVLKLCRYILTYPQAKDDLNDILIEKYGQKFEESPELNVLVRVNTSEFGVQEYFRYILGDIEKATELYIRNRSYVDKVSLRTPTLKYDFIMTQ